MYQESAIDKLIALTARHLEKVDWPMGLSVRDGIQNSHDFWVRAKARRREPEFTMEDRVYGHWVRVRATRHIASDEWTNVGVLMYDAVYGEQKFARVGPFDRAIVRGDMMRDWAPRFEDFADRYKTIEQVRQSLRSTGHHMSPVQLGEPLGCVVDDEHFENLYLMMVLGVKE